MKKKVLIGSSLTLATLGSAAAELPAGIGTALTAAQADAIAAIGLGGAMILAVGVVGVAWRVGAKYLRRAAGAA